MLESLLYLAAAIAILVKLAPSGTSVIGLVAAAIALVAVLATARHGPQALVDDLARSRGCSVEGTSRGA